MLRQSLRCCQHSMNKELLNRTRNGDRSLWSVVLFGLLCCAILPNGVHSYTPPENCTSVSFKINEEKMYNISCQHINLTAIPSDDKGSDVYKLDLSNNQISSITASDFQHFTNLVELNLSNNQISSLPIDTFNNLTNLQYLSLAGNNLSTIDENIFTDSQLVFLDLSSMPLLTLPEKPSSTNLIVLNISYCNLDSLDKKIFSNLINLQEFDASHNAISALDRNLFRNSALKTIDLSWNQISEVDFRANEFILTVNFDIVTNGLSLLSQSDVHVWILQVIKLDLSHNVITDVDNHFLNDASAVTNLDLSYNMIPDLDKDVFEDCPALVNLTLSNNNLVTLPHDIFKENDQLQHVDISHNEITDFPSTIFNYIPDVLTLDLSYNNLSTIQTNLFSSLNDIERIIDLSNNPFVCDCAVKNLLYKLLYADSVTNVDITKCTDTENMEHIYADYSSEDCSGNLGSNCNSTDYCMVRNSVCDTEDNVCVCNALFYDNNGVGGAMGLCKDKVALDYPCDMDTACTDANSECAGTPSKKCRCKLYYYDNQPVYLGGVCKLQVELGEVCSMDTMCRVSNSYCNSTQQCDCTSEYYDNDSTAVIGGECSLKLDLYAPCNMSYQCGTSNAECKASLCNCSTGFYELANDRTCRGPSSFYSCYTNQSDEYEVVFSTSEELSTNKSCEEKCFRSDLRYYTNTNGICLCGNLKPVTSTSTKCCPKVSPNCDSRAYVGVGTNFASAGIYVWHIPRVQYGEPILFSCNASLAIIDQMRIGFGDSQTLTNVSSSSATLNHTYTYAGQLWLSVDACVEADNVCERAIIPFDVHAPSESSNMYITGVRTADVSSELGIHATVTQGWNIDFYWDKVHNGNTTNEKGCPSGWLPHRTTCIKLETAGLDYTSASAACDASGAKLLKIDFMIEIPEIVSLLSANTTSFWLGAQKLGGWWTWEDNTKTVFYDTNFTGSTYGDCVKIDGTTSKLTSANCAATSSYACMTDPVSCPYGGKYMPDGYCYLLVSDSKTWSSANSHCKAEYGGWLANITDASTQTMVTELLTNASVSEAWFGLNDQQLEHYFMWADDTSFDFYSAPFRPTTSLIDNGDCFVTTGGNTWSQLDCIIPRKFVCQYSTHIDRISVQSYVAGVTDISIPAGESVQSLSALTTLPVGVSSGYTVQVMPGEAFSRSGNIRYWVFRSNINSTTGVNVSLHHYKPYCTTGTLIQPGCASNMFATCSNGTHTCLPSDTCSDTQQYCYLSNTCKALNDSCTCNSEARSTDATLSCTSYGSEEPKYKLVGQTMVFVNTSGTFKVPVDGMSIEKLDIIGFQYPNGSKAILCENIPTGQDQQTMFSAHTDDWLVNQDFFPSNHFAVNETCFLQAIFTKDLSVNLNSNLAYTSTPGDYDLRATITGGISHVLSLVLEVPIQGVHLVYPPSSGANETIGSLGTIYTEWNVAYDLIISVKQGTNIASSWTINGVTTQVSFTNTCPVSDACNASLYLLEEPFASLPHNASSVGSTTLTIQIYNTFGSTTMLLQIETAKSVSNVSISLNTTSRIPNNVALNKTVDFITTVEGGTGVSYAYTVDSVTVAVPSSNSTLHYAFLSVGSHIVAVAVSNILGTQTAAVTVFVKQAAEFTNCKFVTSNNSLAAIGIDFSLQVQCEVNIGAEVVDVWTATDRTANVTGGVTNASSSPYTWVQQMKFTSLQTVIVTAIVQDQFEQISMFLTVNVCNAVSDVSLTLNASQVLIDAAVQFEAAVPISGNYCSVEYIFVFGDGNTVTVTTGTVNHRYTAAGNYTVTVTASNGPSNHSNTSYVTVFEEVTGLSMSNDGPKAVNNTITFSASTITGNFMIYTFNSSEFNVTQSSPNFTYIFSSAEDYNVTVTAFNELSNKTVTVIAYIMNMADIRISAFTVDGLTNIGCFETTVSKEYKVDIIHFDPTYLIYDWDFGNGVTELNGTNTRNQAYLTASNYTVTVVIKYPAIGSQSTHTKDVCLQERISSPSITVTSPIALHNGSVSKNVSVTFATGSDIKYMWSTNASAVGSTTDATFLVKFPVESSYSISVNVSNEINHIVTTELVKVIEAVDGVSINCSTCITKSGSLYVLMNNAYTFSVHSISGSVATCLWDYGDSSTDSGLSVSHTFTAVGSYNVTVSTTNPVTSTLVTYITVHVQVQITQVTLMSYGSDWLTNHVIPADKNLDLTKVAYFKAIVLPTGMSLDVCWTYEDGLPQECTNSDIGNYTYHTTGRKTVTVTARTEFNEVNNTFEFYVIEKLATLNLTENGTLLDSSSNHIALLNKLYEYEITSPQIVPDTVKFTFIVRRSGVLEKSGVNSIFSMAFPTTDTYSLQGVIENSLGRLDQTITIEVIEALSGPYINSSVTDENITLGATLTLSAGITSGKYPQFNFYYASSPSGESIHAANISNNIVTIKPGNVGLYVVTLEVYNSVSTPVYVNYTFNVMIGVSGVSIDVQTMYPSATEVGNNLTCNAVVKNGTGLSYSWSVMLAGSVIITGNGPTLLVNFTLQAVYNITLTVVNYASSETGFVEIYSLYRVPTFNISQSGTTNTVGSKRYAIATNQNTTFSNSLTDTEFVSFFWSLNGNVEESTASFNHNFTSAGVYNVSLNASNRISAEYDSIEMVVQDALNDLSVSLCNSTSVINTLITLSATYSGTNISIVWVPADMPNATGDMIVFTQSTPGTYSVNVTASNLVSAQTIQCFITMQGIIDNLNITTSPYRFKGYPVTFDVTGDYIDQATFHWAFSDGTSFNTSTPSVNHTFTAEGSNFVVVTVSNQVSSKTVNSTFDVIALGCNVPSLTVYGSTYKKVRRSRSFVLYVDVDVGDCELYTSIYEWVIYPATSCNEPLGTALSLHPDISTGESSLVVPRNTLPFGTYCVQFTHLLADTPVDNSISFNLTVILSQLRAEIFGGSYRMTYDGPSMILDGNNSSDPDEDSNTVMKYRWTCAQIQGHPSDFCNAVNNITQSAQTLTNLSLNVNDKFKISLTVYADARDNHTVYQIIEVVSPEVIICYITCISCIANGQDKIVPTSSFSLESSCNETPLTYIWTVTDAATSAAVPIDGSQLNTGDDGPSFVLKPSVLSEDKIFTITLTVNGNNHTGISSSTFESCKSLSLGTCSVNSTVGVVPFEDITRVTCKDVTDDNNLTSIYYKIVISTSDSEYIASYSSSPTSFLVLAPSVDGNVSIAVFALNDEGSEISLLNTIISFDESKLPAGTNKLDYLVSKMVSQMKTIARKNSPSELLQYCLAVLNYLNRLSEQSIGTGSQRMAVRDVIMRSLAGLPVTSVQNIQQMGSAMELITKYTNELSASTLDKILTSIARLSDKLKKIVTKGSDGGMIKPIPLFEAINKVQKALKSSANNSTTSNGTVLAEFYPEEDYTITSSVTIEQTETNLSMGQKSMNSSKELLIILAAAKLPGENAFFINLEGGSSALAQNVLREKATEPMMGNETYFKLADYTFSLINYTSASVLQYVIVNNENVYDTTDDLDSTDNPVSPVLSVAFLDPTGNPLHISNVPKAINFSLSASDVAPFEENEAGNQNLKYYNYPNNITNSTKILPANKSFRVDINSPSKPNMATHIQLQGTPSSGETIKVELYVNQQPYRDSEGNKKELTLTSDIMNNLTDHRMYTLYLSPRDIATTDTMYIKVKASETLSVSVAAYYISCQYFDEVNLNWDTNGCEPQEESQPSIFACQCNHLTSFGGSLFVSPDQLDFTDLSEVDFASNPIAIITCSVILFLYIVLVIAFKRMDIMDVKRISLIPLCGKDGSFKYEVTVVTGRLPRAGTTAHVGIRLIGEYGKSVRQHVSKPGAFQRNCSDTFIVAYDVNLGDLRKIQIWHDNSGTSPSWYLGHVIINDLQTDQKYYFFGNTWLTLEDENGTIQREIKVAGAHEMTKFTHRMKTATFNALADKHLWLSLFNRPAQSRFTRAQRVTCCVTVLYVFVGVNAMWYGLLKNNNTELGFGDFGWEELVLALVSNVMVLPFSLGLVYLFKKSRSKPNFFENVHKPETAQTLEIENLCGNSQGGSFESDNTGAVPYDLERESTIDSVPHTALGLHRSRHVAKTHRENTDDSLCQKRPSVAVTQASSRSPLWNEDGIMKWPDSVPTYDDGQDSRPSTGSTMASVPAIKQPPVKAGGSTPGVARKTRKGDAGQLLEELDKLEQDLKETESQSGRSVGHRRSSTNLRRPTMHKSNWGSLEDILNSDDESVADTTTRSRKRGSTTSQSAMKKFNPRADPRIQGNGSDWPKSRESVNSRGLAGQPRGITAALRPGYYSEMTMESRDLHIPVHKERCTLPPWCIYIAYILCFLLSVFSVIVVILYCFKFGYNESIEWVLALILSLILSIVIIEPLKALLIAVYVVAMFKSVEQDEDDDCIEIKPTFDNSNEKIKDVKFKPISGFALLQAKEEGRKIHRMKVIIRQFIAYIFYLWLIMVIVYVNFRYDSYLMTKHVENDFIAPTTTSQQNFTNITNVDEFWDWTENVFAGSLYMENVTEEHGLLLGAPRMRLIRGLTSKCEASTAAEGLGVPTLTQRTCNGEGTYTEDSRDYSEGWNESNANYSWKYYSASQLGSTHKIGHVATYGGGGYQQVLGTTLAETDTIISYLKDNGWINLQTRAVIFEFAIYSSGSDMTSMVALLAEFPLTGGVITSYEIQSQRLLWFREGTVDPLMLLEVILFFVVIYSVIHIALQIREYRKAYFKDLWNWYEMLTTLMTLVSVGLYIGCVVEATNTFNKLLEDTTAFTNFERVMYVHVGMRYLHAWLLFLLMYKVVKQLRFIKFMYVYEQTLSKAVGHLLGSALIFVILLFVYAQVGYLMYGRLVAGFESVGHSITTLVVMIRGRFDFWPMLDHHPVFSHVYVYSYYSFAYGIFTALVIAILTSTYRIVKSQMYFTSTLEMQDYEMIEFMLKRFKLWTGIQKPKPAFRRVRFPGLPSISSRSSSSYSNRSAASLQSSQSLTGPQYSEVQLRCMLTRLQPTWQAVLKRMDKIVALDDEEESLVTRAENEMKDLNWKCRINELERQHKELLSWKNQSGSSKPPVGDAKQRQSILKRLSRKDNQDRKAPATVSGASSRTAASTPADDGKSGKASQGRRPLSDQGARVEPSTSNGRSSSSEKSKLQTFFKSIKPSKSAWNK